MDKVQHFEIPADDIARSKKFYENTFGWKTKDWPMPDGSVYVGLNTGPVDKENMWMEPGFINGGMMKRGGGFPITSPTIAIIVKDIDATLAKVEKAGGTIFMPKKEILGMGWYAYIKDTEGNVVGVWQDTKDRNKKKE